MKPKVVPAATGTEVGKLVASGQVELGVILVNELMAAPGVEVLGRCRPSCRTTPSSMRRRRGLEGLVGGKGADQVPHHAVRRRRVQGEGQEPG